MTRTAVPGGRPAGPIASALNFTRICSVRLLYATLSLIYLACFDVSISRAEVPLPQTASAQTATKIADDFGKVPLSFEPNQGQYSPNVQFLSRGTGYTVSLSHGEALLALRRENAADTLSMQLLRANIAAVPTGLSKLAGTANYFIGNDPQKWRTRIPRFGKVSYKDIYPDVDLIFYGNQRQLEYDFVVKPGGDPTRIAWFFRSAQPSLGQDGTLDLHAPGGAVQFLAPVAYQAVDGQRRPVSVSYTVVGQTVRFAVGSFDRSHPLIIDPVLSYFSYLGGTGSDYIGNSRPQGLGSPSPEPTQAVGIDGQGNLYVAGSTSSTDFPAVGSFPDKTTKDPGQFWAVVSKFSPDGSQLLYSDYFGGSAGNDLAWAIAVDSTGDAYVTGSAGTNDFPVTPGAFQNLCAPHRNNFTGNPIAGCASSQSAFVLKLDSTGSMLIYSTFLGGYGASWGTGIAVDGAGQAYVTGVAGSSLCGGDVYQYGAQYECFPTTANAAISDIGGGNSIDMAFMTVFNATGSGLVYSTLFGDTQGAVSVNGAGCQTDCGASTNGTSIALDSAGNVYIGGTTISSHLLLTPGAYNTTGSGAIPTSPGILNASGGYGYVAKFAPVTSSGTSLVYSTYFGGGPSTGINEGGDVGGLAADSSGNAYVTGETHAADFTATAGAFQTQCDVTQAPTFCGQSGYVAKLNPSGTAVVWGTFFGSSGSDPIYFLGPMFVDSSQNVYVEGEANGPVPLGGGSVSPLNGNNTVYVAKFNSTGTQVLFGATIGGPGNGTEKAGGMAVDPTSGAIYVGGAIGQGGSFSTTGAYQQTYAGGGSDAFVAKVLQQQASTTTLNVSDTSTSFGQPVSFTATVAGPQGSTIVPTGTVTFLNGSTAIGSGTLDSTGKATYSSSTLSASTYTVTASYGGDNSYLASTSSAQTLVVSPASTTTTLTASATTVNTGASVTFTANVVPGSSSAEPTGMVTFNDGTASLGTGALDTSGKATFTTTSLSVGSHSITAVYGGDVNDLTSTSAALAVTVSAPPAPDFSLSVAPSSGSITAGTPSTVTVTVTPQNGFSAATTFACSGLPSQSTCTFNPSTVTPNGAAATTTLTIGSTANTAIIGAGATLSLLLIIPMVGMCSRKQRRLIAMLVPGLLLAIAIGFSGCGGGGGSKNTTNTNNGTPKGTYSVTVTATSGSLTHTATYSFTVQ